LGLTPAEAAAMLDMGWAKSIHRMESDPAASTHRPAPVRVARLYRAYLAGYRPDDWPERLRDREARKAEIAEVRT
jgi:hypothetical protein